MRIRTIKPEFFLHEDLFNAEKETKLPLRVAFAGLWCAADREGRFKWEPRRLGIQILPYDSVDFSRVLDALLTRGFIVSYAFTTGKFGFIPSFHRHQVINNRERLSELPDPLECTDFQAIDASGTRGARDDDAGKEERKGKEGNKEGKGKEAKQSADASSTSDADWINSLSSDSSYIGINISSEYGKMIRWCEVNKKQPSRRRFINWLNRVDKPIVTESVHDPRCAEFLSIFCECYHAMTDSAYPLGDSDRSSLIGLLRALPDLTSVTWREAIEWCQDVAKKEGRFALKIIATGNLSAFCSNWSAIVAYSQTYQEPK